MKFSAKQNMCKHFSHTLHVLLVAILPCEMQILKNDTNCENNYNKGLPY